MAHITLLPFTSSHNGGARCRKLSPYSTYQSSSGGLFERKRMGFLHGRAAAVPCAQSTGGECSEWVMRADFTVVHASAYLHMWPQVMVKTCVFAQTTVGEKERGQKVKRNLSGFLLPICSV